MTIRRSGFLYNALHTAVAAVFLLNTAVIAPAHADVAFLPAPGAMVPLTPSYSPLIVRGIKFYKDDPFKFDFIVDTGDSLPSSEAVKEQGRKLISYFLASLTTPDKNMWVNLSPYEKDRIIPQIFGETEMGKQLLAQDYILKQITASVMYPEGNIGKEFWKKIYERARAQLGTDDVPVNTFNKVWIMPDKAVVYENPAQNAVFIVESHLKVMLEEDYLALKKHQTAGTGAASHAMANKVIREVILPVLEKEVNEGRNFAPLRQVYDSLILAAWYKKRMMQSVLGKAYIDHDKISGVNVSDKNVSQEIYRQYLRAFRKGVYNYIKEDTDPVTNEIVPRKYFSGGENFADMAQRVQERTGQDAAQLVSARTAGKIFSMTVAVGLAAAIFFPNSSSAATTMPSLNSTPHQQIEVPYHQGLHAAFIKLTHKKRGFDDAVRNGRIFVERPNEQIDTVTPDNVNTMIIPHGAKLILVTAKEVSPIQSQAPSATGPAVHIAGLEATFASAGGASPPPPDRNAGVLVTHSVQMANTAPFGPTAASPSSTGVLLTGTGPAVGQEPQVVIDMRNAWLDYDNIKRKLIENLKDSIINLNGYLIASEKIANETSLRRKTIVEITGKQDPEWKDQDLKTQQVENDKKAQIKKFQDQIEALTKELGQDRLAEEANENYLKKMLQVVERLDTEGQYFQGIYDEIQTYFPSEGKWKRGKSPEDLVQVLTTIEPEVTDHLKAAQEAEEEIRKLDVKRLQILPGMNAQTKELIIEKIERTDAVIRKRENDIQAAYKAVRIHIDLPGVSNPERVVPEKIPMLEPPEELPPLSISNYNDLRAEMILSQDLAGKDGYAHFVYTGLHFRPKTFKEISKALRLPPGNHNIKGQGDEFPFRLNKKEIEQWVQAIQSGNDIKISTELQHVAVIPPKNYKPKAAPDQKTVIASLEGVHEPMSFVAPSAIPPVRITELPVINPAKPVATSEEGFGGGMVDAVNHLDGTAEGLTIASSNPGKVRLSNGREVIAISGTLGEKLPVINLANAQSTTTQAYAPVTSTVPEKKPVVTVSRAQTIVNTPGKEAIRFMREYAAGTAYEVAVSIGQGLELAVPRVQSIWRIGVVEGAKAADKGQELALSLWESAPGAADDVSRAAGTGEQYIGQQVNTVKSAFRQYIDQELAFIGEDFNRRVDAFAGNKEDWRSAEIEVDGFLKKANKLLMDELQKNTVPPAPPLQPDKKQVQAPVPVLASVSGTPPAQWMIKNAKGEQIPFPIFRHANGYLTFEYFLQKGESEDDAIKKLHLEHLASNFFLNPYKQMVLFSFLDPSDLGGWDKWLKEHTDDREKILQHLALDYIHDGKPDHAMNSTAPVRGGIDLGQTAAKLQSTGSGVETAFDDADAMRLILNSDGLAPVIYEVHPLTQAGFNTLLGL